jgi:hypothetical protein
MKKNVDISAVQVHKLPPSDSSTNTSTLSHSLLRVAPNPPPVTPLQRALAAKRLARSQRRSQAISSKAALLNNLG